MLRFHQKLLNDTVRTLAYRDALHACVTPGDIVLDIGTGTGILAFFACDAGARRVYAIERQHVAGAATLLARHLGYSDRVEVLHARSTDVVLPEPADLLVTETMGTLGLDEGILSTIIDARKRLLRPDAIIIPHRITLSSVPVELPETFDRHVAWWSEPRYGYDLSPLRVFAANTFYKIDIEPDAFLSEPAETLDVVLRTIESPSVSGQQHFVVSRSGMLHGFAAWFTASLAPGIQLSNAIARATHWGQGFFPLEQPVPVETGQDITLDLSSEDGVAWRWRGVINGSNNFDQTTYLANPPTSGALGSHR